MEGVEISHRHQAPFTAKIPAKEVNPSTESPFALPEFRNDEISLKSKEI